MIRARLLYDDARKDTRKTIWTKVRKAVPKAKPAEQTWGFMGVYEEDVETEYRTVVEDRVLEYGPYIPTLARNLESGGFS